MSGTDAGTILNAEIENAPPPGSGPASTIRPGEGGARANAPSPDGDSQAWFKRACGVGLQLGPPIFGSTGGNTEGLVAAAMIASKQDLFWDIGQEITYSFIEGAIKGSIRQRKVNETVREWTLWANIKFKPVPENGMLRISFDEAQGSWSYVGKQNASADLDPAKPTMNLAWIGVDEPEVTKEERGVILHEFGHVLGLLHEHQSPARGGKIRFNQANVLLYFQKTQGWTAGQVQSQIFDTIAQEDVSNYSAWDRYSIMQYFMPAAMNTSNIEIKPNNWLSYIDKAYIMGMYPISLKDQSYREMEFRARLAVIGMPKSQQEEFIQLLLKGDLELARMLFHGWNEQARNDRNFSRGVFPASEDVDGSVQGACAAVENAPVSEAPEPEKPKGPRLFNAVLSTLSNLWGVGQVITYSFVEGLKYGDLRQLHVIDQIPEWTLWANIKFQLVEKGGFLRITFNSKDGSWSYVGKQENLKRRADQQTMNLGWVKNQEALSDDDRGVIIHEFGHALGLLHEHQSPARSGGVELLEEATISYYMRTQKWKRQDVIDQIISVFNKGEVGNYSEWDRYSVMQYFMPADLNKQGIEVKPNNQLSRTDKCYIMCNYPPHLTNDPDKEADLRDAMTTIGVPQDVQQNIIDSLVTWDDMDSARNQFKVWNEKARASAASNSAPLGKGGSGRRRAANPSGPANALGPSHGAGNAGGSAPKGPANQTAFLPTLISKLKQFFDPGAGQIFVLQFPGRFLDQSLYAWDTKSAGVYGQFVKPTIVNESEFRLVDQLYDIAEVVSAPNGVNLSIVYEQLLNNLLPKYQDNGLLKQQAKIRAWLLKDARVSSWMMKIIQAQATARQPTNDNRVGGGRSKDEDVPPAFAVSDKSGGVNRLELSGALMQEYLQAKQTWELERDTMIEESLELKLGTEDSAKKLNDLTRKLAHITAIREAQLASKYADAVVQGFYHNVRQYLGYLDIKSASEFLHDAKDALREAAMSSMDGALRVFPVQMSPIDWFEGLSTSFTVEDLTSDPELIAQAINARSSELDALNGELSRLVIGTKGNLKDLEAEVDKKQQALDVSSAKLVSTYTSNVIAMAKTCIDAYGNVQADRLDETIKKTQPELVIAEAVLENLASDLQATSDAQQAYNSASRALSDALARRALAEATDTRQQQEQIKIRIASITRDINELTARYTSLNKSAAGPEKQPTNLSLKDVRPIPEGNSTSGGSRWQEITMYQNIKSNYSKSNTSASAAASSWNCNLFIGSGSGGASNASGSATMEGGETGLNIEIGFRATMVTVDRGGWFQPQFFKQSKAYYHINEDIKWANYPNGVNTPEQIKSDTKHFESLNEGLLPGYPVGYIICKDITLKIASNEAVTADSSQYMQQQASHSGGLLCFSASGSNSSNSSSKGHSFQACSDGYVVKIPGPQILGYMVQLTQKDESSSLPKEIPDDFWVPDEDDEDEEGGESRGVGHGANPKTLLDKLDEILKGMGVSEEALSSVHEDMKKDLADLVNGTRA